jgi:glucokinase
MILAGDTGGTKTLLALCNDDASVVRETIYHAAEYPSLEAIVETFLGNERPAIGGACFGVAGPVTGQTAKITNLPWTIDARVLSRTIGGAPVTLLNDLQATALGALVVGADQLAVLQAGEVPPGATIAVIAPGTGLGEAMLVHDGKRYVALPSEGGHADFAPGTDEEIELLRFLRGKYGHHVSSERVLSGAGLGDLYDFVRARTRAQPPRFLVEQMSAGDRNAVIAQVALAKGDPSCEHALAMFVALLGAEAGNLALRGLATGGVVLGGGIPPKILPALQTGELLARFTDKGRFAGWCRALSVRVVLEPKAALYGAAHHVVATKD